VKNRPSSMSIAVWLCIATVWTLARASDTAVSWSSYLVIDVFSHIATFPPSFPPYYAFSESSSNQFSSGFFWYLTSVIGVMIGICAGLRFRTARIPKIFAFAGSAVLALLSLRSVYFMPPRDSIGLFLAQLPFCLTTAIVTSVTCTKSFRAEIGS
jgi:hypothetical protein